MDLLKAVSSAVNKGSAALDIESVFSTYLYTGNGATQSIVNGIDLSTEGGMVWIKERTTLGGTAHVLTDTERGATKELKTYTTGAEATQSAGLTVFNVDGFNLGGGTNYNWNGPSDYTSWTFRKAPRFFNQELVSHVNGVASVVDLSSLNVVGLAHVKSTATEKWYSWHKDLTAGKLLYLDETTSETTDTRLSVSGTDLTIDASAPTGDYMVYAWAHDPDGPSGDGSDGLIACGSYTGGGPTDVAVSIGWEPQLLLIKRTDSAQDWYMLDTMRGMANILGTNSAYSLHPNTSGAESLNVEHSVTADGFDARDGGTLNASGATFIYMAIRRPMRTPESSDEVFAIGESSVSKEIPTGFPVDFMLAKDTGVASWQSTSRLNARNLTPDTTAAEGGWSTMFGMEHNDIFDGNGYFGSSSIVSCWKRATGFMSIFCDTGTGINKTEAHNLGVAPELWLRKGRSGATQWVWGSSLIANTEKINMPTVIGKVTDTTAWNSTYPTSTLFSIGTSLDVNTSTATYITYLFASLAGISDIGTYSGDNSTGKAIDCGFSGGSTFVMIISLNSTRDIFFWDSVRGILAGTESHLSLNTTAAEVTTDDSIDQDNAGFLVNQVAATNINVTGETYLYYAISL